VPQLSVILGAAQRATAQFVDVKSVILYGQFVKIGFTVSFTQGELLVTVTRKEQVDLLFLVSVAV
jgi:hypothetical protein